MGLTVAASGITVSEQERKPAQALSNRGTRQRRRTQFQHGLSKQAAKAARLLPLVLPAERPDPGARVTRFRVRRWRHVVVQAPVPMSKPGDFGHIDAYAQGHVYRKKGVWRGGR